jgi:hypothetical protein
MSIIADHERHRRSRIGRDEAKGHEPVHEVDRPDPAAYLGRLKREARNGGWFAVNYAWVRPGKLAPDEALFLGMLVNIAAGKDTVQQVQGGRVYFLCTAEFLAGFGWTAKQQRRLLTRLSGRRCWGGKDGKRSRAAAPAPPRIIQVMTCPTGNGFRESRWLHIDLEAVAALATSRDEDDHQAEHEPRSPGARSGPWQGHDQRRHQGGELRRRDEQRHQEDELRDKADETPCARTGAWHAPERARN